MTRLGPYSPVPPEVIAALPAADYAYLQSLYASVNGQAFSGMAPGGAVAAPFAAFAVSRLPERALLWLVGGLVMVLALVQAAKLLAG